MLQNIDQVCKQEAAGIEHRKKELEKLKKGQLPDKHAHDVFSQLGFHRGEGYDESDEIADINAPVFDDAQPRTAYLDEFRQQLKLDLGHFDHHDPGLQMFKTVAAARSTALFTNVGATKPAQLPTVVDLTRESAVSDSGVGPKSSWVLPGFESTAGLHKAVADAIREGKQTSLSRPSLEKLTPAAVFARLPPSVLPHLPKAWSIALPVTPRPQLIAEAFHLNRKQRLAFYLIADRFGIELRQERDTAEQLRDLLCSNWIPRFASKRTDRDDTLRMFLGGPAGTGKSHVIAAVIFLFAVYGKDHWLLLTATTGTAAISIRGSTVHSALGLSIYGSTEDDDVHSHDNQSKSAITCKDVRFLVVDEISMATCALLGQMGKRMQRIKNKPDLVFGGVNLIALGDFGQFPPPTRYSKPLYDDSASLVAAKTTQYGRLVWTRLTHVVLLHQQMRVENDRWNQMLERSRYAVCTEEDRQFILKRLVTKDNPVKWRTNTRIVVGRNPLRTSLNFEAVQEAARASRQVTLVAVAQDARSLSRGQRHHALNTHHRLAVLDMADNSTGNLPGKLPLVLGMPCLLRKNIDVPNGLSNGTCGTLVGVILDPREPPVPAYSADATNNNVHFLKYLPQCLLVHFPTLKRQTPVCPGLCDDPQVWPLLPCKETFDYKPTKGVKYRICRAQFPLIPAYASTGHAAQGLTMQSLVCDINGCQKLPNASYVILSRCKRPEDLWILRNFDLTALQRPVPAALQKEMLRLEELDAATVDPFVDFIPGLEAEQAAFTHKNLGYREWAANLQAVKVARKGARANLTRNADYDLASLPSTETSQLLETGDIYSICTGDPAQPTLLTTVEIAPMPLLAPELEEKSDDLPLSLSSDSPNSDGFVSDCEDADTPWDSADADLSEFEHHLLDCELAGPDADDDQLDWAPPIDGFEEEPVVSGEDDLSFVAVAEAGDAGAALPLLVRPPVGTAGRHALTL
jgi:hypothetical protein